MEEEHIQVGPFQLINIVGRGGMGEVWRAVHREHGSYVAVKVISARRAHQAKMARGFFREARAMAGLSHPNIAHIFDYGQINAAAVAASGERLVLGTPYLVMDLADQGTLSQVRGKLDWADLRFVTLSLLDALAHAHARGVIHKDLKPGNVLLTGVNRQVLLTDFGLAHVVESEESSTDTPWQAFGGTPAYMAPEQFYGDNRELGPWTDLYSLGCLIHALITTKPPFGKKNWVEVANGHLYKPIPEMVSPFELPSAFRDWVRILTAKKISDRFECAADAAWALSKIPASDRVLTRVVGDDVTLPIPLPLNSIEASHTAFGELTTLVWLDEVTHKTGLTFRKEGDSAVGAGYATVPMPSTWRRAVPLKANPKLTGTGLNLYSVRSIPMVGREHERSVLWENLTATREEGGVRVVLISGPSGLGASRLARWLALRALELGAASVMSASHSPIANRRDGLRGMAARHLRVFAYPRHQVAERLRETLLTPELIDRDEWMSLTDFVAPVAKVEAGSAALPPVLVQQSRRFELLRNMFRRATRRRPLILLLDDVHWNIEAVEFVFDLLGRKESTDLPVMVVMTSHDGEVSNHPTFRAALKPTVDRSDFVKMDLAPLNEYEQREFIDHLLPLDSSLVARLLFRTGGNPQFAHQLLGDWVARNLLVLGSDGFALRPGVEVPMPESLQEVWRDTVNRLLLFRPENDGVALELAAVLGIEVEATEWRLACQTLNVQPSADLLEALFEQRLAVSPQGPEVSWRFVHGMLREALEMRAHEAGRLADHHVLCATLLANLDGERSHERRGWHLLKAKRYVECLDEMLQAALEHMSGGDTHAAHMCLEARDQALRAIDPEGLHPGWAAGWVLWCSLWRMREDFSQARKYGKQAARLAKELGEFDLLYRAYRELGVVYILCGLPGKALTFQKLAAVAAKNADNSNGIIDAISEQGWVWLHRGDLERSRKCFQYAATGFQKAGLNESVYACWLGLAEVARNGGDFNDSRRWLEKVSINSSDDASRWTQAAMRHFQSNLARSEGDLVLAEKHMFEAGRLYAETGSAGVRVAKLSRALLIIAQNRYTDGQRLLEEVFKEIPKERLPIRIMIRCGLLLCAAAKEDWQQWDHHCPIVIHMIDRSDYVDADVASHLRDAGIRAISCGEIQRGQSALIVSKGIFLALGRDSEAKILARQLR